MSVLDRVKRTATDSSQQSTEQSGIPEAEKSLVMRRISIVVSELTEFATVNADGPFVSHLWVIKSMFESVSEELDGASDEKLASWMEQFGRLMLWCASGDPNELPPEVVEFMQKKHANMFQIEAAKSD